MYRTDRTDLETRENQPMTLRTFTRFALALVMALFTSGLSAQALTDGAVIDPDRGVAYLMNSRGGIDALDLDRGSLRWSSRAAAKPLAITGGRLLALALPRGAEPNIVTLDASGRAVTSAALALPAGVRPMLKDDLTGSFRIEALSGPGGDLLLQWTATSVPARGIEQLDNALVVGEESTPSEPVTTSGTVRVHPATGQLYSATAADAEALREHSADALRRGLEALSSGPRTFAAVAGPHRLVSARQAESQPDRRYRWTISDGATKLGEVESSVATSAFAVRGMTLYYIVPAGGRLAAGSEMKRRQLTLRAIDLATGAERWSRPLVDTRYFGPFPR